MPKITITSIKNWLRGASLNQSLLVLLVFSLPFERIPSGDVAGITVRGSLVVGGLIIVRAFYQLLTRQRPLAWSLEEKLFVGFVLWLMALTPFALNTVRAIEVTVFTTFVITLALAIKMVFDRKYLTSLATALLVSTVVVCSFGLFQYFGNLSGLGSNLTGLRERYSWELFGFPRIQSTALEPLYFASFLLLPLSLLLARILGRNIKWWHGLLIMLGSVCLFMTVSRGGTWAYLFITSLLVIFGVWRRQYSKALLIAALVGASFGLSLLIITYFNQPFGGLITHKTGIGSYSEQLRNTGLDAGGDERARARAQAISLIVQNPVTGVGPGNYGPAVQGEPEPAEGWTIVNNEPLEIAAETGLVGLAIIVIGFMSLIVSSVRNWRLRDNQVKIWSLGLLMFLLATALQYQTFSTLYIVHIWVAVGLLIAVNATVVRKKLS